MTTMETTTTAKKERRNIAIPPYFIMKGIERYSIEEDSKPFNNKDDCKLKLDELSSANVFNTYKLHKHQGRYFIYRKNKI